ncbi:hypothetical protein LptCag_1322 [Leptospirillum ferriphilum]|uniref:Uncharacterized protein n=1 Tax=Leptospirillum ferriphilum TaxID=178606 RepID=A0A094W8W3_9BACT|nr:hypothetical protein LptCag_1322 [Leptospirillum ferriphilum]
MGHTTHNPHPSRERRHDLVFSESRLISDGEMFTDFAEDLLV